ncbi:ArnT family glycosyltransferase [Orrella sp. 11846]|uniref:ArnT family glycosyltransferase n=1 Tax=Orrella sp. 11846 TaxID=3409913 RepID=UPI003B591DB0
MDRMVSRMCGVWQWALRPRSVYAIGVLLFIWLAALAWMRPLHIPDEGRYVGVAWDMMRFESPWIPLLNGLPYFHKPPLFYWLTDLSFHLFGAHEWAARFPSLLSAWLTAMAMFLFVRRHRGAETGLVTLIVMSSTLYYFGAAEYANLDMLVAAMITLTILAGAEAVSRQTQQEKGALGFAILTGVLAALGVLAKGLIGVVLPGAILFFWLLWTRRYQGFRVLLNWPVWVAFLIVVLPWFIVMAIEVPGFLHYFFIYQHFERYLTTGFNQQQPFWFYFPVILGLCMPWTLWLIRYIWQRGPMQFDRAWHGLMLIWIVIIVLFFSLPASKLIGYAVPVVPALSVLIAEAIVACLHGSRTQRDLRAFAITAMAGFAMCLIALIAFMFANNHSSKEPVAVFKSQIQAEDQFVYLDVYPFDLAFYTGHPNPAWVIFPWSHLPAGDTWRNELHEAAEFSPMLGGGTLIEPAQLLPLLCQSGDRTYWLTGEPHEVNGREWLANLEPIAKKRNGQLFWKLPVEEDFRTQWCS